MWVVENDAISVRWIGVVVFFVAVENDLFLGSYSKLASVRVVETGLVSVC